MYLISKGEIDVKKISLLLILLFFVTGCGMHYEVELKDGMITENSYVTILNQDIKGGSVYKTFDEMIMKYDPIHDFLPTYNTEEILDSPSSTLKISGEYYISDYQNSVPLGLCYKNVSTSQDGNYFELRTDRKFTCFDDYEELDSVKVTFKTDRKVVSHNADSNKNGVYTWNITPDNASYKPIELKVDTSKKEVVKNPYLGYYIGGLVLVGAGVLVLFIKRKQESINRI